MRKGKPYIPISGPVAEASTEELSPVGDDEVMNPTMNDNFPPETIGEQEVGGDMPDPDAGSALENARKYGLAPEASEDHPKEIGLGPAMEANREAEEIS